MCFWLVLEQPASLRHARLTVQGRADITRQWLPASAGPAAARVPEFVALCGVDGVRSHAVADRKPTSSLLGCFTPRGLGLTALMPFQ